MSNSTRPAFEINKSLMSPGVVLLFVGFFLWWVGAALSAAALAKAAMKWMDQLGGIAERDCPQAGSPVQGSRLGGLQGLTRSDLVIAAHAASRQRRQDCISGGDAAATRSRALRPWMVAACSPCQRASRIGNHLRRRPMDRRSEVRARPAYDEGRREAGRRRVGCRVAALPTSRCLVAIRCSRRARSAQSWRLRCTSHSCSSSTSGTSRAAARAVPQSLTRVASRPSARTASGQVNTGSRTNSATIANHSLTPGIRITADFCEEVGGWAADRISHSITLDWLVHRLFTSCGPEEDRWRRRRDLNPREGCALNPLSRRAP